MPRESALASGRSAGWVAGFSLRQRVDAWTDQVVAAEIHPGFKRIKRALVDRVAFRISNGSESNQLPSRSIQLSGLGRIPFAAEMASAQLPWIGRHGKLCVQP